MDARRFVLLVGLVLLTAQSAWAVENRFQLTLAGGWGLVSMDRLNDRYIDGFAKPAGLFVDRLKGGPQLIGEFDYFVSSRVSIGIGASYLYSQTDHSYQIQIIDSTQTAIRTLKPKAKLSASMIAPHVQVRYYLSLRSAVVAIGAGIAYGEGSAVISSKAEIPQSDTSAAIPLNYERHLSGRGVGFLSSVTASWRVASRVSLMGMAGYRFHSTETLKNSGIEWQITDHNTSYNINLDFSGLYLVAGVMFGL